jgi:hypothetical protein
MSGMITLAFDDCYEVCWLRLCRYPRNKSLRIVQVIGHKIQVSADRLP